MQLAQRLCELLMCRRKAAPVADYVLLQPSEDVELRELQAFLDENFKQLEITPADLRTFSRDTDVVNHLLKLLPLYRQCQSKCAFLKGYLSEGCLPHTRPAAEVECKKSQRILEALDILILKLVVGEFAMSEADSLEMLLDKFSTDQASLVEVQRVMGLVDMDCEKSAYMLEAGAAATVAPPTPPAVVQGESGVREDGETVAAVSAFACSSVSDSLIPEETGVTRPMMSLAHINTVSCPTVMKFDQRLLEEGDEEDEVTVMSPSPEPVQQQPPVEPVQQQPQGRGSHRRRYKESAPQETLPTNHEREILDLMRHSPDVPREAVMSPTMVTIPPPQIPFVGSARELRGVKKKKPTAAALLSSA
ncbi:tegument protein UL51 [Human betaherpesvirus 5]|nr:tegument protein UL51 [Human betaherpesvirus 5]